MCLLLCPSPSAGRIDLDNLVRSQLASDLQSPGLQVNDHNGPGGLLPHQLEEEQAHGSCPKDEGPVRWPGRQTPQSVQRTGQWLCAGRYIIGQTAGGVGIAAWDGDELGESTRTVQADHLGVQAKIGVAPPAWAAGAAGDGGLYDHVLSGAYVLHGVPCEDDGSGNFVARYQGIGEVARLEI
jgi:hypothetical protein